ncbi:MAG: hypothetical protein LBV28_02305, partial [Puniceicoccales bacterium]|nr:hypothetical protein [Puniceicoccales bacterium]
MPDAISPLSFFRILDPARPTEIPVAWRPDGTLLRLGQFREEAFALAARLAQHRDVPRWALCFEDAANLATAFFAALLAGRQIVLPGHTREALLREMHGAGHFEGVLTDMPALRGAEGSFAVLQVAGEAVAVGEAAPSIGPIGRMGPIGQIGTESLVSPIRPIGPICPIGPIEGATVAAPASAAPAATTPPALAPTVSFFTSGSTGQPKCVTKTIAQLQIEHDLHAAHWGQRLPGTHIVGTTAHHHLYGLQFRVLLPLSLGVPFNATLIEFHEQLLAVPRPFALITSPAFLKRLDDHIPLPANSCRHIHSAGGFLPPDTATRATALLGIAPF